MYLKYQAESNKQAYVPKLPRAIQQTQAYVPKLPRWIQQTQAYDSTQ
jgi:hypothetical protein